MDEKLLQYIWYHKLFNTTNCYTNEGDKIQILSVGIPNSNSGPDFLQVKIQLNKIIWVGCVEVHVKSSDWGKHKHQHDDAYNNVILHVVYEHDKPVNLPNLNSVPTLELKPLVPKRIIDIYASYMQSKKSILCSKHFSEVDSLRLFAWLDRLLVDRLEEKIVHVSQLIDSCNQHLEEAFYVYLAYYFGFNINNLPFRLLAKTTPLYCLSKHKNNLFQLEAMLFGQAGMLEDTFSDEYPKQLQKEYMFLKQKFSLERVCKNEMWKFAKTYPSGFPSLRVAQFAALMHHSVTLLSNILESTTLDQIQQMIQVNVSDYWENHYMFDRPSSRKHKVLGLSAINTLIINAVLPYMYHIASVRQSQSMKNRVIELYEALPFEKNNITVEYQALRHDFRNAFHSQALIQLKKKYCQSKSCLSCGIGLYILKCLPKINIQQE